MNTLYVWDYGLLHGFCDFTLSTLPQATLTTPLGQYQDHEEEDQELENDYLILLFFFMVH
jgi:hypothetical protein